MRTVDEQTKNKKSASGEMPDTQGTKGAHGAPYLMFDP